MDKYNNKKPKTIVHAPPISLTLRDLALNEKKVLRNLTLYGRNLLKKSKMIVIHNIEAQIPLDGLSDGYTASISRNYPILEEKNLYIGWGDINTFEHILAEEKSTLEPLDKEEEKRIRENAIWKLLYNRLNIEPVTNATIEITDGIAIRTRKERIRRLFFNQDTASKISQELKKELFPEDDENYRKKIASQTSVLALKEFAYETKAFSKDVDEIGYMLYVHNVDGTKKFDPRKHEDHKSIGLLGKIKAALTGYVENKSDRKVIYQYIIPEAIKNLIESDKNYFVILVENLKEAKNLEKNLERVIEEENIDIKKIHITPVEEKKGFSYEIY